MIYVCARFEKMPEAMMALPRLYAYPTPPDPPPADSIVILDSGAFALAKKRQAINSAHMERLAEYYEQYATQPGYRCIAPDVYLDPSQTMRNWRWWQEHVKLPVVPVIQFRKARRIDLHTVWEQARFYAPWRPDFVAISNPGLWAIESRDIVQACQLVRQITGCTWLHNLGAGWSPQDVAVWRDLACFDSIDSTMYYTDAVGGWLWQVGGGRVASSSPWREIATINAQVANQIAAGPG